MVLLFLFEVKVLASLIVRSVSSIASNNPETEVASKSSLLGVFLVSGIPFANREDTVITARSRFVSPVLRAENSFPIF